jgi:hypothetical protein
MQSSTQGAVFQPRRSRERGQALILAIFALAVAFGFVALAIDIGLFYHERRDIQNAVDAAALAGAQELPLDGATAEAVARQWAAKNEHGTPFASLDISYRCVIGDRNSDGMPDLSDIPAVCNPGASASFVCQGDICVSHCDFGLPANTCNSIVVKADKQVKFPFASVLNVIDDSDKCIYDACSSGEISGVACRGSCGAAPSAPLDLVMIIDRTSSMSVADLDEAKSAAKSALTIMNPEMQHVALTVLSKARPGDNCNSVRNNSDPGEWTIVDFKSDYLKDDGTLNTGSELVSAINCLNRAVTSGNHTNLGDPTKAALDLINAEGRPGVKKAIILLTDGQANQPVPQPPCQYAYNQASAAKSADVEIFTIAFGVEGAKCDESGSPYHNVLATRLIANMATDSVDETGCDNLAEAAVENADPDHFLCQPKSGDLEPLFKKAAEALATGSKLINVPE